MPPTARNEQDEAGEVVVLTGSSGCLGQQTLKLLISRDEKVSEIRCLDLVEPSEQMQRSIRAELDNWEQVGSGHCNEEEEAKNRRRKVVNFIKGDIRDINTVESCLDGADCVLHCAAKTDIWLEPADQDPIELESINVHGTENLLRACVRLGVAKFVHVSSFETFVSLHTIYYATESTLPEPKWLLFGPSAETKREAENKVRQYSNNKLKRPRANRPDYLNAVILRFTPIYGPGDKYFVTRLLRIAKYFNGTLQRFSNVWIRQQPIYVGNAAWSLVRAKQRMDSDESVSREDFHITDDTQIGDPFDFLVPFLECRGMRVTKSAWAAWPVWLVMCLLTFCWKTLKCLDVFNLVFAARRSRLDEARERDRAKSLSRQQESGAEPKVARDGATELKWHNLITTQMFYFVCNSLFLNRTKASLRLDYEPLFGPEESLKLSLDWYKNQLEL